MPDVWELHLEVPHITSPHNPLVINCLLAPNRCKGVEKGCLPIISGIKRNGVVSANGCLCHRNQPTFRSHHTKNENVFYRKSQDSVSTVNCIIIQKYSLALTMDELYIPVTLNPDLVAWLVVPLSDLVYKMYMA